MFSTLVVSEFTLNFLFILISLSKLSLYKDTSPLIYVTHEFIFFPWTLEDGIYPSGFGKTVSHNCSHKYLSTSKTDNFLRRVSKNSFPQAFLVLTVLRSSWMNLVAQSVITNSSFSYFSLIKSCVIWNNNMNMEGNGEMTKVALYELAVLSQGAGSKFQVERIYLFFEENNFKSFQTKLKFQCIYLIETYFTFAIEMQILGKL